MSMDSEEHDEVCTAWNTRPREAELEAEVGRLRALVEKLSDAQPLPSAFVWTGEGSEERLFDAELRHENGKKPVDYLKAWLSMLRPFAFATRDDSWGEMEKLLSIVMRNYVRHLRNAATARTAIGEEK